MSTGHPKVSLSQKLGIKNGFRMAVFNAPHDYREKLGKLPDNIAIETRLMNSLDFIHFFAKSRSQLEDEFPKLKMMLSQKGMIWISWPKGSSGLETDLNENVIRKVGLNNGLVDIKVAAIDEIWSGLKFVFRLKDRR